MAVTTVAVVLNLTPAAKKLAVVNEFFIKIIGSVFSALPFSALGVLIVATPIFAALVVFLFVRSKQKGRFALRLAAAVLIIVTLFICAIGFNYSKESVYAQMGLDTAEGQDSALLLETAEYFLTQTNEAAQNADFGSGHSAMGMSFDEMSQVILESYDSNAELGFLYDFDLRPKRFQPAFIMNYAGTAGMFFPWFAEINVCGNLPDLDLVFTAAHEIGHSKGVMNEGECNFLAIVVCISSENAYVRYSGFANGLSYLLSEVKKLDKELDTDYFIELYERLDERVKADYRYCNEFYKQFKGPINEFFDRLNDIYLKGNKVEGGIGSYSQAVRGILAYFDENYRKVDKQSKSL